MRWAGWAGVRGTAIASNFAPIVTDSIRPAGFMLAKNGAGSRETAPDCEPAGAPIRSVAQVPCAIQWLQPEAAPHADSC
jgi:hypothetical protein